MFRASPEVRENNDNISDNLKSHLNNISKAQLCNYSKTKGCC